MKRWIIACLLSIVVLVVAGCGSIPLGDGASIEMKKDGFTINSSEGQQGSIDISVNDDGEMTLSGTDESGQKFEQKVSKEQTLPEGLPQDLPIPADAELTVIKNDMGEGSQVVVSYDAKGKVIDIYNKYREYVEQANYSTIIDGSEGKAKADTVMENIMAKSDGKTLSIGVMKSATGKYDDGTVAVNLLYFTDIE